MISFGRVKMVTVDYHDARKRRRFALEPREQMEARIEEGMLILDIPDPSDRLYHGRKVQWVLPLDGVREVVVDSFEDEVHL